ncbi:hypothetical protein V495_02866 [Pseudogymnoascus sp. VKM F-4514 (FW-929)]|nr:hypothetical protein V495_02866 [Pseudogymnoascus sp. VKM F-4514 (FW-929)]KFY55918.1 hypothetical protein V497_06616 [Pseudogymnoascus sp. VKM F-4516 (FW-969)]
MIPPHEVFFFLTGGTGPRPPTCAAFFEAAARRTAKTKEVERECEERKERAREEQFQREKALKEISGVGVGVMRPLGLGGLRRNRLPKGSATEQDDKKGEAPGGGGDVEGKAPEEAVVVV